MLASPAGVLVILPALVIAAGVTVLSLGRAATRETAETMARHQLNAQARAVEIDVKSSLKQAEPVLATMKTLANVAMSQDDALTRLYDAVRGRPGIYNATIAFPIGVTWGAYFDDQGLPRVHQSRVEAGGTTRVNYKVELGKLVEIATKTTQDDTRTRPYYVAAEKAKQLVWLPPRVFQSSGKTGLTVAEPVLVDGELKAVMSIDYDVASLSTFLTKAPLEGARSVLFTPDGTILAHSAESKPRVAQDKHLRRHTDFDDPALEALFETAEVKGLGRDVASGETQFIKLGTRDGDYLASVAPINDSRLTGYLATLVPESSLLSAMHRLNRTSIIASAVALAIAIGIALLFAWNLVRMRRAVGAARAEARSAEARAKQLGSYKLVERLGLGGQGEVWRAEHQLLARRAAIKLVRSDAGGADAQERFRREAQTLASMNSRHTIELYDYGVTDDGTFFYVMELLDGLDLAQLVKAHGPLPAARVIKILVQACQSLAEAHAAGLLHRDIKPANLVLCRAADEVDIIKVLDFGIVHHVAEPVAPRPARAVTNVPKAPGTTNDSRLTVEGSVIGTPGYIPPEQATAQPLDPRGDVYSLACVAWYLLTGTEVFPGKTIEEILLAHVEEPTPELKPLVQGWLPFSLEALIIRCLAKIPDDRPDARELAKALREIEIPAEHAWTEELANAWWAESRVVAPPTSKSEAATAVGGGMLVAHHAPQATVVGGGNNSSGPPPMPAEPAIGRSSADAATMVARPSSSDIRSS
jgi:serine/threonine protein kinase